MNSTLLRIVAGLVFLFQIITPAPGNAPEQETLADIITSELEKVIDSQFLYIQGPIWHPDGFLLFTDISGNRWRKDDNGVRRDFKAGENLQLFNQPSILIFDREGRLISCEKGNRRITRIEKDCEITVITDNYMQKKFKSMMVEREIMMMNISGIGFLTVHSRTPVVKGVVMQKNG